MNKICFLALFVAVPFVSLVAQTASGNATKTPGRTAFYAELGGSGIMFSANVDTRFKASRIGWGGRAGIGFVTASEEKPNPGGNYPLWEDVSVLTVPVQVNYIFGKGESPHTFEVGGGLTYVGRKLDIMNFYDNKRSNLFGTFSFMYRRQPVDGGFMWRIGFTPIAAKGYIQPFGAVGVGYSF